MPIYKPSELRDFLESLGIAPKKGLSQNFLIDGNILRKIIATADVKPGDLVVEVGPGPGSLTEQLLQAGAHVIAVEKDTILAGALERLRTGDRKLDIYCDDIMTFPMDRILAPYIAQGRKAKVIANLPYHLTTPIIAELAPRNDLFTSLTLMVQEEVARRFVAKPKTPAYGSFTVFLNFYTHPKYGFTVKNTCFYPSPSVSSAIVVFDLKEPPKVSSEEAFFLMTRTAFKQRRKMMRGSLRDLYTTDDVEKALMAIGQPNTARPEELSLEEFLKLFKLLNTN